MSEGAATTRGEALVRELKWVHDLIRRDLATVRRLAEQIPDGLAAREISDGIESLAANGPLWQLRVNCLHYCRFVHSHHTLESYTWFPALRAADPSMNPIVERLEGDHANVAGLLDEVDAAAGRLAEEEDDNSYTRRDRLVVALERLASDLLAHLDYEEEHTAAILRTWTRWPFMEEGRP
jgi:hypothetical protein